MGPVARPWDPCLDAAMIPTFSSRSRPGSAGAAYWRWHPPTTWKASQALLLEESIAQAQAEPSQAPAEGQALSAPIETATVDVAQDPVAAASQGGWLPLLVWALVVVIDGVLALRELVGPSVAHWQQKAPWSRRERRSQGAISGGWPAPVAGLH
ncbi:hypothetical protein KQ304_05175 [Synechococcus sp. CS-1329]|nr:hypothetical protein [Synechococcus sp. CS-1329]